MSIIQVKELSHIYSKGTPFEKTAIDRISFDVNAGETIGLLGHTGSGKSTLIEHMNALLQPSSGTVLFNGSDIFASKKSMHDCRSHIGLVFQYPEYQLFEETIFADIAFGPKNLKLSESEIEKRVYEAASFVGIHEDMLSSSPLDLSGGEKRRIAIAGVLAMCPEVLILDEPAAGLDPAGRNGIMQSIVDWKSAHNATVIFVTHDMELAAAYCSRLLVLSQGKLLMDGSPAEIFSQQELLRKVGLNIPPSADIAQRLRDKGIPVSQNIYTLHELIEAVTALKKGGSLC